MRRRNTSESGGEIGLLEGEDTTNAQDEIVELKEFTCFNLITRETVEDTTTEIVLVFL